MNRVIVSCEHGGNLVPPAYRELFRDHADLLGSHRGHDPGAALLARHIARRAGARLMISHVTRLLVDLNRSLRHPSLFSTVTRALSRPSRRAVVEEHYLPYRRRIEDAVHKATEEGIVLHLSVHTFAPELDGRVRDAAIGLLYDPSRLLERRFSKEWRAALVSRLGGMKVRSNYPYRGSADGLTTHLRRTVSPDRYVGIELEVNQRYFVRGRWSRGLREEIAEALLETIPRCNRTMGGTETGTDLSGTA